MKIVILCFNQFTDIDVFLPWELLNRVKLIGGVTDWEVKIIGTKENHVSMAGLCIPTSGSLEEIINAYAILISSGVGVQKVIKESTYLESLKLNPEK